MKVKQFIKTEGIIRATLEETVSKAVANLQSSHDAAFVFDEKGKYRGIVNPYYSLIKGSSHKGEALVKHVLHHPPRVTPEDSIERAVGLMMDVRLHYLPVVDKKGEFMGILSARRILKELKDDPVFSIPVLEALQMRKKALVSVYETDEVTKVVNLFDREDVSKLIVIDENMKLKGIMSYYDLIPHLIAPVDNEQLYPARVEDQDQFAHLKVKNVAQSRVHTRKPESMLSECVDDIVKLGIGSVVIVNREGFPSGIVTTRDLLRRLKRDEEQFFITLTTNNVSDASMQIVQDYGVHLERWIKKIKDLVDAHMIVREDKNGSLFKVSLHLNFVRGNPTVYQEEGKDLLEVLQKINKNN